MLKFGCIAGYGELAVEGMVAENVSRGVLWSPRPLIGKKGSHWTC